MAADMDLTKLAGEAEGGFTGAADDLPAQGGGRVPTILPGIHSFRLPGNIDQCWQTFDIEKKGPDGTVLTWPAGTVKDGVDVSGKPQTETHLMLAFDSESPMVCVDPGGEYDGLPVNYVSISTLPRRRGKDKPGNPAPRVPDMTYFVRKCLQDNSPVKSRADWVAIVNKHAGAIITVESGLSAHCDPSRTRYISDGAGGVVEDPDGNKGCGGAPGSKSKGHYYTSDFRMRMEGGGFGYVDSLSCTNCGAILRGFFRIEQYLAPAAVASAVQA